MSRWWRTPEDEPSVHEQAMENLRSVLKFGALGVGGVFLALAVFAGIAMLILRQGMPSEDDTRRKVASAAASAVPTASPTPSERAAAPPASGEAARRRQVVSFLEAALVHGGNRWRNWMPAGSGAPDRFSYTPPKGGAARSVRPSRMSDAQDAELLAAVTRDGAVRPATLAVSESTGGDGNWRIVFVVEERGGAWHHGAAEGRTTGDGTALTALTYR